MLNGVEDSYTAKTDAQNPHNPVLVPEVVE